MKKIDIITEDYFESDDLMDGFERVDMDIEDISEEEYYEAFN